MTLRVASIPRVETYRGNPYWKLLQQELEQLGVDFVTTHSKLYIEWRWLVRNRSQVDVLHIHFIRHHYEANEHEASFGRLAKFVAKLVLARLLGYRVVWTVHNLFPHERLEPKFIGRFAHLAIAQLATALIVHCEAARAAVAKAFFRSRCVHVVHHPNYIGAYSNSITKEQARVGLGLEGYETVFLYLGSIRPYKGIERLVEEFKSIPGPQLALIVAGKPWDPQLVARIEALSNSDTRIHFVPRFIRDAELQTFMNASDALVLPYRRILSGGSPLLGMSFGRPVVAPSIGCLREVITESAGILYSPSDPGGLRAALVRALSLDLDTLGRAAYERAALFTWQIAATRTIQAYTAPLSTAT